MKYLITGGAGFIGSTLVNRVSKENKVVVVDDLSMGDINKIHDIDKNDIRFIKGSVTDQKLMSSLFQDHQFDYIFHLAAVASVADSVARPVETHKVNFESVLLLLELCRNTQHNLKRLVFSSSAAVYGDEDSLPKFEESVIRPLTPYAVDKFAAERYVLNYNALYDVPTSAVRFFNVYGPNQNPNSPYSGVLSILTDRYEQLLNGEKSSFTIFGDGNQTRDFIFVEDVIDALLLVANSENAKGNVYNVGTGEETSLRQVISLYKNIVEMDIDVDYEVSREGDIEKSFANIDKIKSLGFVPKFTINRGIKAYLTAALKV